MKLSHVKPGDLFNRRECGWYVSAKHKDAVLWLGLIAYAYHFKSDKTEPTINIELLGPLTKQDCLYRDEAGKQPNPECKNMERTVWVTRVEYSASGKIYLPQWTQYESNHPSLTVDARTCWEETLALLKPHEEKHQNHFRELIDFLREIERYQFTIDACNCPYGSWLIDARVIQMREAANGIKGKLDGEDKKLDNAETNDILNKIKSKGSTVIGQ